MWNNPTLPWEPLVSWIPVEPSLQPPGEECRVLRKPREVSSPKRNAEKCNCNCRQQHFFSPVQHELKSSKPKIGILSYNYLWILIKGHVTNNYSRILIRVLKWENAPKSATEPIQVVYWAHVSSFIFEYIGIATDLEKHDEDNSLDSSPAGEETISKIRHSDESGIHHDGDHAQ